MQLRPYQPEDFHSLYELEEICFPPHLRFEREYMQSILERPSSIALVVVDEAHVVAFAVVTMQKRNLVKAAYIETIEVMPEYRRKKLAQKLLRSVEKLIRAQTVAIFWLHVDVTNERAIKLYEGAGFVRVKELQNFYPDGNGAYVYKKELAERIGASS